MSHRDIPIGEATEIEVSAEGDLNVSGWDQRIIQIEGDEWVNATAEGSTTGPIRLRFEGDGRLRVPSVITVRISDVSGDTRVRDLSGTLELSDVSGDVRIEEIRGPVQLARVEGDLKIQRIDGPVSVETATSDLDVRQINGPFTCDHVGGDATIEGIAGPLNLTGAVGGDVAIAEIGGPTSIGEVGGDLNVVNCQSVSVRTVSGDLTAKDLRGDFRANQVAGDAQIAGCDGPVDLEVVNGDLTARALPGGIHAPRVNGRIRLSTSLSPDRTYDLVGRGAVTVLIEGDPTQVSATFELRRSGGGRIDIGLPLEDPIVEPGFVRGRIGAGAASVRISSEGALRVEARGQGSTGFNGFMEAMFDEIGEEFRGAFGSFSGFGWGGPGRGPEERGQRRGRRAEEKLQEAAQRVAEEAERHARHAAERAQRQVERAARQAERHAGNWRWFGRPIDVGPGWINPMGPPRPVPPRPPAPPPRPRATEDERLTILNMLAAGTIGPEDAARLLEALGS